MYEVKLSKSYYFALISVLFVSLIFNLFIRNEMDFSYLVLDLNDVLYMTLQKNKDIFQYIFYERIKQLILLIILVKGFGIEKIFELLVILGGGIMGCLVSSQVYYLGMLGLIILMVYMLPHFLIYFLGLYFGYKNRLFSVGKDNNLKILICFCVIFFVGMILEALFMTFFLKNFYQYMVN